MTTPAAIEEYLAAVPEPSRTALEELRATIRATAPEATEVISYQMPAFKDAGRLLVSYAAFKKHYSLFVMSTQVLDAFRDELEPFRTGKGTLSFSPGSPLPTALVEKLVRARLDENEALRRR